MVLWYTEKEVTEHRLNLRKTIQATGVLLRRERGSRMNYMRLLKVLYIADRECLRQLGHTITRDRYVAMERGPVLSTVLDLVKDRDMRAKFWTKFFRTCGYQIEMTSHPGLGTLSKAEIDILHAVSEKYEGFDEWDMVKECHTFPEWVDNQPPEGSVRDIPLAETILAVGRKEDAEHILEEESASSAFDRLLAKCQ